MFILPNRTLVRLSEVSIKNTFFWRSPGNIFESDLRTICIYYIISIAKNNKYFCFITYRGKKGIIKQ